MFIFLTSVYGKNSANLIFSTIYAFIGFNVANCFNYNFFVDVELLPLVALGIKNIVNGKAPWLYLAALSFSIFSSFYFGFFLCVASLVLFLMFLAERDEKDLKIKKSIWLKYSASSLTAGLLPAFLWVPAFLSFFGGRAEQNSLSDFKITETMSFAEAFAKLFTGANGPLEIINGKPNIYCGILVVFLVIFFFVDKRNSLRAKIVRGLPLAFYFVTFYVQALSMVLNGLTKTNWFNFRYSFVFSFLLLLIAYEQFRKITVPAKEDFKRACIVFCCTVLVVFSQKFNFVAGGFLVFDLLVLAIYIAAIWLYWGKKSESDVSLLIPRIMVLCALQCTVNFAVCTKSLMVMSITKDEYKQELAIGKNFANFISSRDRGFYRAVADPTIDGKKLASRLYGYNGSNYFGSGEQTFVFEGFGKLGMNWWRNRMWYSKGESEIFDSLLGIKYIVSGLELNKTKGYEQLAKIGKNFVYLNSNALPLAILSRDAINSVKLSDNVFENYNNIWNAVTGLREKVIIDEPNISFKVRSNHEGTVLSLQEAKKEYSLILSKNELNKSGTKGKMSSSVGKSKNIPQTETPESIVNSGRYIECDFIARHDGNVYSSTKKADEIGGTVDGDDGDSVHYLGKFRKGERVTDYISIKENVTREDLLKICAEYAAGYVNLKALEEYSEIIKSQGITLRKSSDHYLEGKMSVFEKKRFLLLIPYNPGWKLYVDNSETKLEKTAELFMSASVAEGKHEYKLVFAPVGYQVGKYISFLGLIMLLCSICVRNYKINVRPG